MSNLTNSFINWTMAKFFIGVATVCNCVLFIMTLHVPCTVYHYGRDMSLLSGLFFVLYDSYVCRVLDGSAYKHIPYVVWMCRKTISVKIPLLALLISSVITHSTRVNLNIQFVVVAMMLGIVLGYVVCIFHDTVVYPV